MRVCDIDKNSVVENRYVMFEVPLDFDSARIQGVLPEGAREVHDIECGKEAATAIEGRDWGSLQRMTPAKERAPRPGSSNRSDAARRAAETRRRNKEAAQASTTAATAPQAQGATAAAPVGGEQQTATQTATQGADE